MDRFQILKDYVHRRDTAIMQHIINLRQELQQLQPDVQEILELTDFLRKNKLRLYQDDANPDKNYIFKAKPYCDLSFEIAKPYCTDFIFYVDINGKYYITDQGGFKKEISTEAELNFLNYFCQYFPAYRDRFFAYIESFQNMEV